MTEQFEQETIHVDLFTWMKRINDKTGKVYYMLGMVRGYDNTLAVTPVGGLGETRFFCLRHNVAYLPRDFCMDCRLQLIG